MTQYFYKTEKEILKFLKKHDLNYGKNIYKLIANEKYGFVVDVEGDVDLSKVGVKNKKTKLNIIPIKFNFISGNFYCTSNKLTSLEFAPESVRTFDCAINFLKDLTGCPKIINGSFDCSENFLINLKGLPKEINGSFSCADNQIESLEFVPQKINGNFDFCLNNIKSIEYFPNFVSGYVYCDGNENLGNLQKKSKFDIFYKSHLDIIKKKEMYESLNNKIEDNNVIKRKNKI